MQNRSERPPKLTDFKAKPPTVEVTREPKDEADVAATRGMIERYTQPDGFHCPRCPFITKNIDDAVEHLAEEMNKALAHLGRQPK